MGHKPSKTHIYLHFTCHTTVCSSFLIWGYTSRDWNSTVHLHQGSTSNPGIKVWKMTYLLKKT